MVKKFDVIVVGELNVDIILNQLPQLPEIGKEIFAANMNMALGSSSAIFAANLSRLGCKVAFLGKIGKDYFGNFVLEKLGEFGVNTEMVRLDNTQKTGATIVMNYDNDRANVTYAGAMANLTIEDIKTEYLALAKHLHLSSCFLQEGLKNSIAAIYERAKSSGLTTSFDPQWDPLEKWDIDLKTILPHVDVFLPNEIELINLTGAKSFEEAITVIKGISNIAAIKQSEKGSTVLQKGEQKFIAAFHNPSVVDAIGAGDTFNAGFIYKFLQNAPLESCQRFANLTGYVNTTGAGGTGAFSATDDFLKMAMEKFNVKNQEIS